MKLILSDVADNPLKRWAKIYGCDEGWNVLENSVYEILAVPDYHPALDAAWPDFLEATEYYEGNTTYRLCVQEGDLYLIAS